jgi:aryl-alcohol dehydrogenase-like predicted oxidoreductase
VIRRPNTVAIPGASSVDQLVRNAEAGDLELSDDEDAQLTSAAERYQPVQGAQAVPKMLRRRLPI